MNIGGGNSKTKTTAPTTKRKASSRIRRFFPLRKKYNEIFPHFQNKMG